MPGNRWPASVATWRAWAAASSALDGTQPLLTQVPPILSRSTMTTRRSLRRAAIAAEKPAPPEPMIGRSRRVGRPAGPVRLRFALPNGFCPHSIRLAGCITREPSMAQTVAAPTPTAAPALLPAEATMVDTVAKFFRALGDPTRLRLLEFLLDAEHTVSECVAHVGLSQGRVSVHLACLADCGYVACRRAGRNACALAGCQRIDPSTGT